MWCYVRVMGERADAIRPERSTLDATVRLAAAGPARGGAESAWLGWGAGDALGVALVPPAILTFATAEGTEDPFRARSREAVALFASGAVATTLVFSTRVQLAHLLFPIAI